MRVEGLIKRYLFGIVYAVSDCEGFFEIWVITKKLVNNLTRREKRGKNKELTPPPPPPRLPQRFIPPHRRIQM